MIKAVKKIPKLSELTLREKIGQTAVMQMSWFMNKENLSEYLAENPIGNVWHNGNFNMNTANLSNVVGGKLRDSEYYRKWTLSLRNMMKIPPFIGLDPLSAGFATNIKNMVSAPTVGAANSKELAYKFGRIHARAAKSVGANYIWAPVVDIPSRFSSAAIMRAVSDELPKLCDLASEIIKGMQDENVAATAKHFPGYDEKEYRDSHFSPVCVGTSKEDWKKKQGASFQAMIDKGVHSIMIHHTGFPAVDDRKLGNVYIPATLSANIITKLLKEEMGFSGVVITDSVDMAGLLAAFPNLEDLYVELLNAGNDLLLNVKRYDYIDIIEKAVIDGRISEERIDDACGRILKVKEMLDIANVDEVIYSDIEEEISSTNREISEKAITLECDLNNLLPLDSKKIKNVAIICSTHKDTAFEALNYMKAAFEERGMRVHLQRRLASDDEIKELSENNDLLIYAGYLGTHAPMGASSFYDEECATFFYAFTQGAEKSIGVSLGSVYMYYDFYTNANTFVHAYSLSREAQEAFVKAIFGEIPFLGAMPYVKPGPREE